MGLTIHYALRAPGGLSAKRVAELVVAMRETACRFQREGRVDRVGAVRAASAGMRGFECRVKARVFLARTDSGSWQQLRIRTSRQDRAVIQHC